MKTHFIKKIFFSVSLTTLLLISCSDEVNLNNGNDNIDPSKGLTIRIPNPAAAAKFGATRGDEFRNTRAEEDAKEGTIQKLWFCAFPVEDSSSETTGEKLVTELTGREQLNVSNADYDYLSYSLNDFKKGSYHIYLLANLDEYLAEGKTISTDITEQEVKDLILNFTTEKYLQNDKLPMATWCDEIKSSASGNAVDGGVFTYDDDNYTVYADLTFLCSKVRYTILFNAKGDGISKDFGNDYVDFTQDDSQYASNLRAYTAVDAEKSLGSDQTGFIQDSNSTYQLQLPLTKYAYPKNSDGTANDNYPSYDSSTGTVEGNLTEEFSGEDYSQIAWQGIVYIPENLASKSEEQSYLNFNGVIKFADSSEDDVTTLANKIIYIKPNEGLGNKRGNLYDIRAKIENYPSVDLTFSTSVHDWTLQSLTYSLHGPYELTVDKTSIEMESGKSVDIAYSSNTTVSFSSPIIYWVESAEGDQFKATFYYPKEDGKYYDLENNVAAETPKSKELFDVSFNNGIATVEINNEIPFRVLNQLVKDYDESNPSNSETNFGKVNYFHITAGNLNKKILVNKIDASPYLNVSPQNIIIEVREYVNSGKNSEDIEIEFETNVDISVARIKLTSISETDESGNIINVTNPLSISATFSEGSLLATQKGIVTLKLTDFFSGESYWKIPHSYTLTFELESYEGVEQQKVTITTDPFTTDYTIHFRCFDPDDLVTWSNPHVYIYQCLELPADLTGLEAEDGTNIAGKTVGFFDDGNPLAGLEYLFSNNVSFKGWMGYGGTVELPTEGKFDYKNGFVVYKDYSEKATSIFNPEYKDANPSAYNYSINLNAAHQANRTGSTSDPSNWNWVCEKCRLYEKAEDYNQGNEDNNNNVFFAGVAMEQEKENGVPTGWWKYTLSGIANPGKCLIIFFDGHKYDDVGFDNEITRRYPTKDDNGSGALKQSSDRAGIPLFDFPNNEGWLLFDGNGLNRDQNFESTKPEIPYFEIGDELIINWWSEYSKKYYKNIYAWNSSEDYQPFGAWSGKECSTWNEDKSNSASFMFDRRELKMGIIVHKDYDEGNEKVEYKITPSRVTYVSGEGGKNPKMEISTASDGHKIYSVTLW